MSLTVAALIAGGVAGSSALGFAMWKSQTRKQARLEQLAKSLELSYEASGRGEVYSGTMKNIFRGQYLGIEVVLFQKQEMVGDSQVVYTIARTVFHPNLRMGLSIKSPRTFVGALKNKGVAIGQKDFDKRHEVSAVSDIQAKSLFASGLTESFMQSKRYTVSVTDEVLQLKLQKSVSEALVVTMLRDVTTMHAAIVEARRGMPRSDEEMEIIETWTGFSLQEGMRFDAEQFAMVGKVGRFETEVRLTVDPKEKWRTHFLCKFPRPLGAELKVVIQPSGIEAAKTFLSRLDEIKLGDSRFDEGFWVAGDPKERVIELLQEDVRTKLLRLSEDAKELELRDQSLQASFTGRMVDETALARTLRSFTVLCENLYEHASEDKSEYR